MAAPANWTATDNYIWDGSQWVSQGYGHSNADHTGPPGGANAMTTSIQGGGAYGGDEGVTYYAHPVMDNEGLVWSWEWKTEPFTGEGIASWYIGTPQDPDYDLQDIYGLSESVQGQLTEGGVVDSDLVSSFMRDIGLTPTDIDPQQLARYLEAMPKWELDETKKAFFDKEKEFAIAGEKEKFTKDIYGLQEETMQQRSDIATRAGESGVRTGTGQFVGGDELSEKLYTTATDLRKSLTSGIEQIGTQYQTDIYGLEEDVVADFSNWLQNLTA